MKRKINSISSFSLLFNEVDEVMSMKKGNFVLWDGTEERWIPMTDEEIKQRLGICHLQSEINSLKRSLNDLSDIMIKRFLIPESKEKIIKFLGDHPEGILTSHVRRSRIDNSWDKAWNIALEELRIEGSIIASSRGKGKQRIWTLKKS